MASLLRKYLGRSRRDSDDEFGLRSLLELTPDGVLGVDADGTVTVVNQKAEKLFGYAAAEMTGTAVESLLPNIFGTNLLGARTEYMSDPKALEMGSGIELFGRREGGDEFPVEIASTPHQINGNRIVLLFVRGIAARRLAEAAVVQREQQLSQIIYSALDAVVGMDADGAITSWNPQAERTFGWSHDEVIGKPISHVIIPERYRKAHAEGILRFLKDGASKQLGSRIELTALHRHGHEFDVELAVTAHEVGESHIFTAFITDITERKRARELLEQRVVERTRELEVANQDLEVANQDLEAFSYSVSHDLRAPLRAIRGFSDILLEESADRLDAEGRRVLGVVAESAATMTTLIDDLLRFSRMSRHSLAVAALDMNGVVASVMSEIEGQFEETEREVSIGSLPPARGDLALIRQVWVNLLSNAFKFSGSRDVVRIQVDGRAEGEESVYSVKDNGAGFDMAHAEKLFTVFERLHLRGEYEGTGVGLSIVKRIVERHGGRVWAEGKVDEGATFWFTLPASEEKS